MRNRVIGILMLFAIISVGMLNRGQSMKYIADDDEMIDWQSYSVEELI